MNKHLRVGIQYCAVKMCTKKPFPTEFTSLFFKKSGGNPLRLFTQDASPGELLPFAAYGEQRG